MVGVCAPGGLNGGINMGMICKICSHPRRLDMDRRIVQGDAIAKIAKDFGVSYSSLYSHSREHISRQMMQHADKVKLEESHELLAKIDGIITRAEDIFQRNYKKGKDIVALKALSEQRSTIQLLASISYALHQAKLQELEIRKMESGEADFQEKEEFRERLQVLTTAELKMFQRIMNKVEEQDPEIIVIPDEKQTMRRTRSSKQMENQW